MIHHLRTCTRSTGRAWGLVSRRSTVVEAMLVEGRDLIADYDAIRQELGRYRSTLLGRREIVVLTTKLVNGKTLLAPLLDVPKVAGP